MAPDERYIAGFKGKGDEEVFDLAVDGTARQKEIALGVLRQRHRAEEQEHWRKVREISERSAEAMTESARATKRIALWTFAVASFTFLLVLGTYWQGCGR
jgi:hypothetical protein